MKSQDRINEEAKRLAEIISYLTKKWYHIMEDTGLSLAMISPPKKKSCWKVVDKNYNCVKKGTFKQCADYILTQWRF